MQWATKNPQQKPAKRKGGYASSTQKEKYTKIFSGRLKGGNCRTRAKFPLSWQLQTKKKGDANHEQEQQNKTIIPRGKARTFHAGRPYKRTRQGGRKKLGGEKMQAVCFRRGLVQGSRLGFSQRGSKWDGGEGRTEIRVEKGHGVECKRAIGAAGEVGKKEIYSGTATGRGRTRKRGRKMIDQQNKKKGRGKGEKSGESAEGRTEQR